MSRDRAKVWVGILSVAVALLLVFSLGIAGEALHISGHLKAEQNSYEGRCPIPVRFTGELQVKFDKADKSRKVVKWQYVTWKGTTSAPHAYTFTPQQATHNLSYQFDWRDEQAKPGRKARPWVAVRMIEPEQREITKAFFEYHCQ